MSKVVFSSYNLPKENGACTYLIWKHGGNSGLDLTCIGTAYKNRYGQWAAKIGRFEYTSPKFESLKQLVLEKEGN